MTAVTRLCLTDFRNHRDALIEAANGFVLLSGPNGAGKTNILEAVSLLESDPALNDAFSPEFIGLYAGVKRGEFETFMQVISPWEREFLLLNV